ncbi:MAG TPA: hypothetical protein VF921_08525 [Vicinamibacterales bacterium]
MPAAARAQTTTPAPQPPATSPLSIHLGDADFLIGGFLDATAIVRSTNVGSGMSTTFGSIPFGNTPQGNLRETRFTSQNSRLSLLATTKVGGAGVKGYVETDFLGAGPANAFVTTNANTLRMRLYWVQYARGTFEFLGGQSWSLLTPNRSGLSPVPADVFFSQNVDTNYQVGLTWARQTQFRFIAHPSKALAAGVSLENPQQYVGPAVVLPAAFASAEVDASGNTAAPNPYPDIIGKVAFDPQTGKTHQHVEVAAVIRGFKTYSAASGSSFSATGRGASVNANLEPVKGLHLIATSFFSDGGGRYIAGLAPDFIVNADSSLTLVGSKSATGGVEAQVRPRTLVFGYYGTVRIDRQTASDAGKTVGYGVAGATGANHAIDETTVGVNQTFFREPRYGAMQLISQYSYLTRTPWSVPDGAPRTAHAHMVYVDIRYILP